MREPQRGRRIVHHPDCYLGLTETKYPSQELKEPRRSGRVVHQPDRYLGLIETQVVIPDDGIEDPLTYKQAMNDVNRDQWIKAMDLEKGICTSIQYGL